MTGFGSPAVLSHCVVWVLHWDDLSLNVAVVVSKGAAAGSCQLTAFFQLEGDPSKERPLCARYTSCTSFASVALFKQFSSAGQIMGCSTVCNSLPFHQSLISQLGALGRLIFFRGHFYPINLWLKNIPCLSIINKIKPRLLRGTQGLHKISPNLPFCFHLCVLSSQSM